MTNYIPHSPTTKQAAFLLLPHFEALYGGAAGGGKSDALLMAALQYVDVPGYAALLLRRTYADLSLPEAIMSRAHEWLAPTNAHWSEKNKTYSFPTAGEKKATLTFGYLQTENDKFRYQSSAFQMIGFDELTQFEETQYRYLLSRVRRLEEMGAKVPLRVRGASNPGGIGHAWVYERFVDRAALLDGRVFIPALLDDNPYLDTLAYEKALDELDEVTRQQLRFGVWITDPARRPYDMLWWRGKNRFHVDNPAIVRQSIGRYLSLDTAAKDKQENDNTAWLVADILPDYRIYVRYVHQDRMKFPQLVADTNTWANLFNRDGKLKGVIIEDKSTGTSLYQTLKASAPPWLADILIAWNPSGDKIQRAQQAATWCSRDCVLLPHPSKATPWLYEFERELYNFPDVMHDDRSDTFAQLILYLEQYLALGWHARRTLEDDESKQIPDEQKSKRRLQIEERVRLFEEQQREAERAKQQGLLGHSRVQRAMGKVTIDG